MKMVTAALAAVVVFMGMLWWLGRNVSYQRVGAPALGTNTSLQRDADGDGLSEWQELLWVSDPTLPDSDGDGMSDGAEVAARRNPTKAGPYDSLSSAEDSARIALTGRSLEPSIPAEYESLSPTLHYKLEELHTVASKDPAFLKSYGESMRSYLAPLGTPAVLGAASSSFAAIQNREWQRLQAAREARSAFQQALVALLATDVPISASSTHLMVTNSVAFMAELAYNMESAERQPVLALESARRYEHEKDVLARSFVALNDYFSKNGIRFSTSTTIAL